MKAYEKFNNSLRKFHLWEEWVKQGEFGRVGVENSTGITIFVHEGEKDEYSMLTFPPINEMACDVDFRLKALSEFHDHDDTKFVFDLCRWVARPNDCKCPLYPVDVYFLWNNPAIMDFEDDVNEDDVCEDDERDLNQYCNHCDCFVKVEEELKVQKCPNCGKWITPCSICPLQNCSKHCPLDRLEDMLNEGGWNTIEEFMANSNK